MEFTFFISVGAILLFTLLGVICAVASFVACLLDLVNVEKIFLIASIICIALVSLSGLTTMVTLFIIILSAV